MMKILLSLLALADIHAAIAGVENCRAILPVSVGIVGETVQWNGPCVNGYAEGVGSLIRLVDGKQVGSFQGRMSEGLMAEGYEKKPDGSQYEGQYKQGLPDGRGEWVGKDYDNYAGEWRNGVKSGWGIANYSLGGRYEGPWDHDQPSGKGKITYAGEKWVETDVSFPSQGADAVVEHYALKDPDRSPRLGDLLPPPIAKNSAVPFDKGFAEMTPEHQQLIRSAYPLLHPNDIPPYPLHGRVEIFRWLSQAQKAVLTDGVFYAQVDVDPEGNASKVRIFETPNKELGNFIAAVLLRQKYSPAQCANAPCAMRYPFKVSFTTN